VLFKFCGCGGGEMDESSSIKRQIGLKKHAGAPDYVKALPRSPASLKAFALSYSSRYRRLRLSMANMGLSLKGRSLCKVSSEVTVLVDSAALCFLLLENSVDRINNNSRLSPTFPSSL
jgi:hypothetical protein